MNDGINGIQAEDNTELTTFRPSSPARESLTDLEELTSAVSNPILNAQPPRSDDNVDFFSLLSEVTQSVVTPSSNKANEVAVQSLLRVHEESEVNPSSAATLKVQVEEKEEAVADLVKIKAIQELVKNEDGTLSTQAILSEGLKQIAALGPGYEAKIVSNLVGNPPEVEAFSVPSAPGKTYYKMGVSYSIIIIKDGKVVPGADIPEIKREVYTTSKTPEGAIIAANNLRKTVVDLALATSDPKNYKGRFEEFSKRESKDQKEVMDQRSFKFNYEYDSKGNPIRLVSIQVSDKGKKEVELEMKPDPEASKYIYYRDLHTKELRRVEKGTEALPGEATYVSEEESLLNAPFVVKETSPYDRLEKSQTIDQQIAAINRLNAEIKRREAEMVVIKSTFFKEPRLKLFFAAEETTEFKQFQANLAYDKAKADGKKLPDDEAEKLKLLKVLSPAKQEEIMLTAQLEKTGNKQDVLDQYKQLIGLQGKIKADPLADIHNVLQSILAKYENELVFKDISATETQKIDRCIQLKEQELAQFKQLEHAKQEINMEMKKINNSFVKFQMTNDALKRDLAQLENIREGASKRSQDPQATENDQIKAQQTVQSISEKEIKELRATIEANDKFLEENLPKISP